YPANPPCPAFHEDEYSLPDRKPIGRLLGTATATLRCALDVPAKLPPPPAPPESKLSARQAAPADCCGALLRFPVVQNPRPFPNSPCLVNSSATHVPLPA